MLIRIREAARQLGMNESTFRSWIWDERVPAPTHRLKGYKKNGYTPEEVVAIGKKMKPHRTQQKFAGVGQNQPSKILSAMQQAAAFIADEINSGKNMDSTEIRAGVDASRGEVTLFIRS